MLEGGGRRGQRTQRLIVYIAQRLTNQNHQRNFSEKGSGVGRRAPDTTEGRVKPPLDMGFHTTVIVDPGVKIAEIPIGQFLEGSSAGRISGAARGLGIFVCAIWHVFGIW